MIEVDSFTPPVPVRCSYFASRELVDAFKEGRFPLLTLALGVAEKKIEQEAGKIPALHLLPSGSWRYCIKEHDNGMTEIEVEAFAFEVRPPK